MAFFCQQCGECCSHMSQIHAILEDCGDGSFVLYNRYTGEKTLVRVDPEKRSLYEDREIFNLWPEACPFLRKVPQRGKICCTVHQTRPDLCREFGCWRMLILDAQGNRAGRVMGSRFLHAEHSKLSRIWDEQKEQIQASTDEEWDRTVIGILRMSGYRVRT
jgi:Fe-S-cluster containining protein